MGRCKNCGKVNKDQADFCVFCGSKLEPTGIKTSAYWAGFILIFAGFMPLSLGLSNIYGGITTQQMYEGTILEGDPQSQQIIDNMINWGISLSIVGIILILIGVALMFSTKKKESPINL